MGFGPDGPKTGRFYIVDFARGGFGHGYHVDDVYSMAAGMSYSVCSSGDGICESASP